MLPHLTFIIKPLNGIRFLAIWQWYALSESPVMIVIAHDLRRGDARGGRNCYANAIQRMNCGLDNFIRKTQPNYIR